jgi:hypothetical protein
MVDVLSIPAFTSVEITIRRGLRYKVNNGGDEPIWGTIHIFIWTCHNETPCITIINKQKCLFF